VRARLRSADGCDRHADWFRRREKRTIGGDPHEVAIEDTLGGREVGGVVDAQRMRFAKVAGPANEVVVNVDEIELAEQTVELVLR